MLNNINLSLYLVKNVLKIFYQFRLTGIRKNNKLFSLKLFINVKFDLSFLYKQVSKLFLIVSITIVTE